MNVEQTRAERTRGERGRQRRLGQLWCGELAIWTGNLLVTRRVESGDESSLPGCLDSAARVVLTHVRNRFVVGDAVEDREASQSSARSPETAATGDLDAFGLCSVQ